MIETRVFLVLGHRFDPLAVSHEPGRVGRRNTALVHAHADAGRNVNPSARGVELGILTPITEAGADSVDCRLHTDNAF